MASESLCRPWPRLNRPRRLSGLGWGRIHRAGPQPNADKGRDAGQSRDCATESRDCTGRPASEVDHTHTCKDSVPERGDAATARAGLHPDADGTTEQSVKERGFDYQ